MWITSGDSLTGLPVWKPSDLCRRVILSLKVGFVPVFLTEGTCAVLTGRPKPSLILIIKKLQKKFPAERPEIDPQHLWGEGRRETDSSPPSTTPLQRWGHRRQI
jgi:hypothetical protein